MKRLILPIFFMAVILGCMTEKVPEPVTEVGWFTPYVWSPEFISGQVKSLEQRAYWATEQDGKYIQGGLIIKKERDSIGWSDDFIAYFDSLGLAKKVKFLGDDGEAYGYWEVHAEDGKYMKAKWIVGDSARNYFVYSHNDAGHVSKFERYSAYVDTLISKGDMKTNEKGQWTWSQMYNYKGEPENSLTFEYNEAGLVTSAELKNSEGNVISWAKYTYDEKGLDIAGEGMSSDSTMYKYEAEYTDFDEKDNWLKMITFEYGKLVGMDVRTIEYY